MFWHDAGSFFNFMPLEVCSIIYFLNKIFYKLAIEIFILFCETRISKVKRIEYYMSNESRKRSEPG